MWVPRSLTNLKASTACYGDSFTFLCVHDVRTSQKTQLRASTACYGGSFTFLHVDDICIPQETPTGLHGPIGG
jgi:hypothetical protein